MQLLRHFLQAVNRSTVS